MDQSPEPGVTDATVRRVNPLDDSGWDERLRSCPGATIFHSAAWAAVLHRSYGYTPVCFVQERPEQNRNIFPLMEVDSWLTGRRGVALPFTDECPPLCADAASLRALFDEAKRFARSRNWKYLECRGGRALFGDAPASTAFYGHRLRLGGGEDALFARLDDAARRAVRKAQKSGVAIEVSQRPASVREFYRLLCRTRRRHGLPPQPFSFFENISELVLARDLGYVVLARHGKQAVAGAMYFRWGREALFKYGASDESFQELRANNLVMWEAIRQLAGQGCEFLDFGRTSLSNEGLRRFKLGWGTEERRIEYVRYDTQAQGFATARDEAEGWYNRVFRCLPLPLSRLAGVLLYKHVA